MRQSHLHGADALPRHAGDGRRQCADRRVLRAQQASALIVTEGTQVLPSGKGYIGTGHLQSRAGGGRLAHHRRYRAPKAARSSPSSGTSVPSRIPTCSPAARCQ